MPSQKAKKAKDSVQVPPGALSHALGGGNFSRQDLREYMVKKVLANFSTSEAGFPSLIPPPGQMYCFESRQWASMTGSKRLTWSFQAAEIGGHQIAVEQDLANIVTRRSSQKFGHMKMRVMAGGAELFKLRHVKGMWHHHSPEFKFHALAPDGGIRFTFVNAIALIKAPVRNAWRIFSGDSELESDLLYTAIDDQHTDDPPSFKICKPWEEHGTASSTCTFSSSGRERDSNLKLVVQSGEDGVPLLALSAVIEAVANHKGSDCC